LQPYRKNVFLACKTTDRTAAGAAVQLDQSLKRLRTDYLDLYQLHGIVDVKADVDRAFAKGGAMELFIQAKKSGRIRHLGFSAHSEAAALEAMNRYDFDSVLLPVSFSTYYKGNFGQRVIAAAKSKDVAILAIKSLARQKWPANDPARPKYPKCWYQPVADPAEAALALRFTLSQPVSAAIAPGDESIFKMALDLACDFKPITEPETQKLKLLAADLDPIFTS